MSKRKSSSGKKGLIIFLAILAVLGVGAGTTAILTKGFKQWGEAEIVKGGVTVAKFEADKLQAGTLTLIDKDDNKLTASFEGEINDDEKLILGDSKAVAATTKSELETTLDGYELSPKQVEEVENYVLARGLCKFASFSIALNVEYDKEEKANTAVEYPWFDAIRVNYKISAPRLIMTANKAEDEAKVSYRKRINNVTSLYENIALYALKEDETMSQNNIDFVSFSLEAEKDNTVEIQSIELIRTTVNKHKNDSCWVTQA